MKYSKNRIITKLTVLRVFLIYTNQPKPLLHRNVKCLLVIISDGFFQRKESRYLASSKDL